MANFKRAVGLIALGMLLVSCGFSVGEKNTWDVTQPIETGVTVEATGSIAVVPDGVSFNFSVFAVEATSRNALESVNNLANQARQALSESKISKNDIATQNVNLYQEFSYSQDGNQTLVGFRATQTFAVTLHDTDRAGETVDAVVASVGTDLIIDTLAPVLLNSDDAADQAREAAIKIAMKKAKDYADLLGVGLGSVISVREFATSYAGPQPWLRADMSAGESAKSVVNLGVQEVSVTVEVRWALTSDN